VKPEATPLTRPPFAQVASLGPAEAGREIVATLEALAARSDRLEHSHELAMRSIGVAATDPLVEAGRSVARDIDRGIGAGVTDGYHNAQHYLEVMLCTRYLAAVAGLDGRRAVRVVTAGLIHDFHHDGSRGMSSQFRLEMLAVEKAQSYLREFEVGAAERSRLEALVLATEPRAGVPFARACWAWHRAGGPAPPNSAGLPAPLQHLLGEAELAHEAVLLAEADVLPSVGLTIEHAEQLQARLAQEWGTTLGRADKLQFIERMIGDMSVAAFFIPNVLALRRAYLEAGESA
jgi:hypothetical protein